MVSCPASLILWKLPGPIETNNPTYLGFVLSYSESVRAGLRRFDFPTFALGWFQGGFPATWRDERPISVGFFLLLLALARPNGPPMLAHEFWRLPLRFLEQPIL